ncbi:MAG TPA: glycosyltransferase family 1 protein [Stellaceae bacterium]|jgi:glycosyltransferase involved in cell wall biosynthesis|nr:glycosyltransferase family 1 protein [Stellaceae bacterium]
MTIAYDVTRLVRRYGAPSPNGIDRIDIAFARHFLPNAETANVGVYLLAHLRPSLMETRELARLLGEVEQRWNRGRSAGGSTYETVKARLLGNHHPASGSRPASSEDGAVARLGTTSRLLRRPRAFGRFVFASIPPGAVFLHGTHLPKPQLFHWLAKRQDVTPVFFIHDLLPLQFPEYFAPTHIDEHRRAMDIFARYGRAAIVNTNVVAQQVRELLRGRGRRDIPMLVRPMPPDPVFAASRDRDPELGDVPYFVVCGTIEPRKNHLILLHVWRELSRQWRDRTPKLMVIGRRGWENENVVDLLDRSHEIHEHVIEIDGLASADMARLFAGARALLMPSFAEGYGLPIVEARATGTPVIAADIPPFREIAPEATFRRPLDGTGWLAAIKAHAEGHPPPLCETSAETAAGYFSAVEAFIRSL